MAINPLVAVMSKSLDALSLRQQVIAQNLSNLSTPGYQPLQVNFEEALINELEQAGGADPSKLADPVVALRDPVGSTVVLDQEVALLSQTVLQYQALVRGLNKQMAIMQLAVSEGRR